MKKNFSEYYRPADKEIVELGEKTAIFFFDTNILLDFYRINPNTLDKAFETIKKFKDRIYITRHTDKEYHKHHYEVPAQMCEMLSHVITHLNFDKIKAPFEEVLRKSIEGCVFPTDITNEFIAQFQSTYDGILKKMRELQQHYEKNYKTHELQNKISELFENHVLEGLTKEKIKDIVEKEGPRRYKEKIPPGYMDAGKATEEGDNNAFGDLITWMEILDFVEKKPQDVIFICRDQKEDWISKIGKKHAIGPRIELLVEFRSKAKDKIFHILTLTEFLKMFGEDFSKEELAAIPNSTVEVWNIGSELKINPKDIKGAKHNLEDFDNDDKIAYLRQVVRRLTNSKRDSSNPDITDEEDDD